MEMLHRCCAGLDVHQKTVVRVHVDGPDMATVSKVFDEILAKQLAELPATG